MEVGQRARAHVPHPLRPYEPLIVNAAIACVAIAGRPLATAAEVRKRLSLS
jgi:hypothetical protein